MIYSQEENDSFSMEKWVCAEALNLLSEPDPSPDIALALVHALVEFNEDCEWWYNDDEYRADYLKLKNKFVDLIHTEAGNGLADRSVKNFLKHEGYLK